MSGSSRGCSPNWATSVAKRRFRSHKGTRRRRRWKRPATGPSVEAIVAAHAAGAHSDVAIAGLFDFQVQCRAERRSSLTRVVRRRDSIGSASMDSKSFKSGGISLQSIGPPSHPLGLPPSSPRSWPMRPRSPPADTPPSCRTSVSSARASRHPAREAKDPASSINLSPAVWEITGLEGMICPSIRISRSKSKCMRIHCGLPVR